MLEKASDDRAHANVLRQSRHPGLQRAHPAHHEVDRYAGLRSPIQRLDDRRLDQRVHLCGDARGFPLPCALGLRLDRLDERLVQGERRLQQLLQLRGAPEPGELLEHVVDVLTHVVATGEQADVRVMARIDGVVIARTEVNVATQLRPLAAHDQQHLRVGLVADDAVDDLGAELLQAPGEIDVGLIVEARAQLDDGRDFLACTRRPQERFGQRRIVAGAIQRLLDGQHVGVVGRLPQQVHDGGERLVRMMQDHVPGSDRFEQIVALRQSTRQPRAERGILEVVTVDEIGQLRQAVQVHGAVGDEEVVARQLELLEQELDDRRAAVGGDLEAYGVAVIAPEELALQCM